jgi:hypothetical protein
MNMQDECPWLVLHRVGDEEHGAWLQRAFLIGDFRPGLEASSYYCVGQETGTAFNPLEPPVCEGCGKIPDVNDLNVREIATGKEDFLLGFRTGMHKWPAETNPKTCWWCNSPSAIVDSPLPVCRQCEDHLRRF